MKWKSWKFGALARRLPVLRGGEIAKVAGCVSLRPVFPSCAARRFPSAATPENLSRILEVPEKFLVKKRRDWDVHKVSRLYCGEHYPVPATREIVCENCWVHIPSGTVLSADKEVLWDTSVAPGTLYQGHSEVSWEDAPWIEEGAFLMATAWGANYAHWLMDALPRLSLPVEERLLMGKEISSFQSESLSTLGFEPDRCIRPIASLVRCRRLRIHVAGSVSGIPHPAALATIRAQILKAVGSQEGGPARVYISRQRARRKILNDVEVDGVLREFDFQAIEPETMDFLSQVKAFSKVEAAFGVHGAGTLNTIFQPPGSVLIEAYNPEVWDHSAHRIASMCGVRHTHFFGSNAGREFDVTICPRILRRTLALALADDGIPPAALLEEIF